MTYQLKQRELVNPDVIWTGYAVPQGQRLMGFYALQQAVFDRYHAENEEDNVRIYAVAPAARLTNHGIYHRGDGESGEA